MEKVKSLFYRQKILLALLEAFDGRLSNIDLQKYLFLFTQICQKEKSYEFVPFKFGCFSFQSYADRRRLTENGALKSVDHWELTDNAHFLGSLKADDRRKIELFREKYAEIKGNDLIREVYRKYPYYATRSEIAVNLMNEMEMQAINAALPNSDSSVFYTIGYEGRSFENYLNRLIINNVKVLIDVRKNPLSRKYGFSKKTLSETLGKLGIVYMHMPEFGIASEKRQTLKVQADYDRLFDEYEKTVLTHNKQSIRRLFSLFLQYKRVAITCFEEDVCMCHRSRVVGALTALPEWDHEVRHI